MTTVVSGRASMINIARGYRCLGLVAGRLRIDLAQLVLVCYNACAAYTASFPVLELVRAMVGTCSTLFAVFQSVSIAASSVPCKLPRSFGVGIVLCFR